MQSGEIIIYQIKDGQTSLEVKLENNTIWLRQEQISQLFGRERSVISKHIANLFKEKELEREANVQILHIPNSDKPVAAYNLDVIISVGYRVKSAEGTRFRMWANKVLKDYLVSGYAVKPH